MPDHNELHAAMTKSATTLRIELLHVDPMVWRRVIVSSTIELPLLHSVIQAAMGWEDKHVHLFELGGIQYGTPDDEFSNDTRPERGVKLNAVLGAEREFEYQYDFGDNWIHRIVVEHTAPPPSHYQLPLCLAGENACPPEDVGGAPGYADFLAAIRDPSHARHVEFLAWVGGIFDPAGFDINAVNCGFRLL